MTSKSDWLKIIAAAEAQNWRKEETRKGVMLYPPDPTQTPVAIHNTPSDQRAIRNLLSLMRQRGFQWPWPPA